jgi:hypothetical protein
MYLYPCLANDIADNFLIILKLNFFSKLHYLHTTIYSNYRITGQIRSSINAFDLYPRVVENSYE